MDFISCQTGVTLRNDDCQFLENAAPKSTQLCDIDLRATRLLQYGLFAGLSASENMIKLSLRMSG